MAVSAPEAKDKTTEAQEKAENEKKKPQLKERQLEFVDEKLEEAVKEGVLRREDRLKVYANINSFSSSQIERAEEIVKEYIEKKRKKREKHIKDLDKAVLEGLLSVDEHKQFLAKHDKLSGTERKKETEDLLPKRLERRKLEKKDFQVLLQESPHFSHKGKITPEGQKLLDEYNDKLKNPREKMVLKRRLIQKTNMLNHFADTCKKRYQVGTEYFKRGEYEASVNLMKKNVRTCERYPESARLQELKDFAQSNLYNGGYELQKNQEIRGKREEVQECYKGKDHQGALECAQEATKLTERFLQFTYDGGNGEYSAGKAEEARGEKWKTPHMRALMKKTREEEKAAQKVYETFLQKEQKEEQRIREEETEEIDNTQAEDKRNQALIKAATDTLDDTRSPEEETTENEQKEGEAIISPKAPSAPLQEATLGDLDEEREIEDVFREDSPVLREEGQEEEEQIQAGQSDITGLSQEELQHSEIVIDEQQTGRLQEKEAEALLRANTTLRVKKKNTELDTKEKLQQNLSEKLAESGRENIQKLKRTGKISKKRAREEEERYRQTNKGEGVGREILSEHQRTGRTIEHSQQQQTQTRLSKLFKKGRGQEDKPVTDLNELRRKNEQKKKEQLR